MQQSCKCRNCDKELFSYYVKGKSSGQLFRVSSNCPFCLDVSFKPLVSGYSVDEKVLKVVDVQDNGEELYLTLERT